jgi:pentatricopeptide repeat protein
MLINACCKGSQHERAFHIFEEWKKTGRISAYQESEVGAAVSEDRISYMEDTAFHMEREVLSKEVYYSPDGVKTSAAQMPYLKPDLVTYNTLMKSCADDPLLAKQIMAEIVSAGFTPDQTSWTTYIDAYGSNGDLTTATKVCVLRLTSSLFFLSSSNPQVKWRGESSLIS